MTMEIRRSSLELMLEKIQQMENQPEDVVPALPIRPVKKARLPLSRRKLPLLVTLERSNCQENGSLDMILPSFEENIFKNKRKKSGDFDQVFYQQESSGLVIKSADENCDYKNDMNLTSEKVINSGDGDELLLDQGAIALQSFIRGENARKTYIRNMSAIAVIQKHMKGHLRSRTLLDEQGQWAWKYFNSIDNKGKQLNGDTKNSRCLENMDSKIKDQIEVPYSVLVDLRGRVQKTEALLDKKKEENDILKLKIKKLERKREQYEANMKYMEKMWQDQFTSIQVNLAADRKNCGPDRGKLGQLLALPETDDEGGAGIMVEDESEHVDSHEDLRKLKIKFKGWKKEFKARLLEAKTTMKTGKNLRNWWGKKMETQSPSIVQML